MIMNDDVRIEELWDDCADEDTQLVLARDLAGNINFGSVFLRASAWTLDLLKRMYAETSAIHHPWWESEAFIRLYNRDRDVRSKTTIVEDWHLFNAFPNDDPVRGYRAPDFVVHFAGFRDRDRMGATMRRYGRMRSSMRLGGFVDIEAVVDRGFSVGMVQERSEVIALATFLSALQPKNVLEIGAGEGGLFYVLCQFATGKTVSVDLPAGPYGGLSFERADERDSQMSSWGDAVSLVRGDSDSAETLSAVEDVLGDERLDFVLIDSDHSYEGVARAFELYLPFVRPGGWIALHDVVDSSHHRRHGVHVARFWREIKGQRVQWSCGEDWAGFGLVQVA